MSTAHPVTPSPRRVPPMSPAASLAPILTEQVADVSVAFQRMYSVAPAKRPQFSCRDSVCRLFAPRIGQFGREITQFARCHIAAAVLPGGASLRRRRRIPVHTCSTASAIPPRPVTPPTRHNVKPSHRHAVTLSNRQIGTLSNRHTVTSSRRQPVNPPGTQFVRSTFWYPVTWQGGHPASHVPPSLSLPLRPTIHTAFLA